MKDDRRRGTIAVPLLCVLALGGLQQCKKGHKDSPACIEARDLARTAGHAGDLVRAKSELERAKSECTDRSEFDLMRIEQLIAREERRQKDKAAREARERAQDERRPVRRFIRWAGKKRDATDKSEPEQTCAERGTPDFGFCVATFIDEQNRAGKEYRVKYSQSDDRVLRFEYESSQPVVCEDFGEHRVVREWKHAGNRRTHCEVMERPLNGVGVLLTNKGDQPETHVWVFSRQYVDRDSELRQILDREGL